MEESKMKNIKILVVILAVAVLASSMVACGNNAKNEAYEYADNWQIPSDIYQPPTAKDAADLYQFTEEMDFTKEELEHFRYIVEQTVVSFRDFAIDGDDLGSVNILRVSPDADRSQLSSGAKKILDGFGSFYDSNTKTVLLIPGYYDDNMTYAIIHGITHSVIHAPSTPYLEEGLVDYYALKAMDEQGLSSQPESLYRGYYEEQRLAINILQAIYGEDKVLEMSQSDQLGELVDEASKSDMGAKLEATLNLYNNFWGRQPYSETLPVQFDIMGHMLKNAKSSDDINSLKEELKKKIDHYALESTLDNNAKEYLEKLLEQ